MTFIPVLGKVVILPVLGKVVTLPVLGKVVPLPVEIRQVEDYCRTLVQLPFVWDNKLPLQDFLWENIIFVEKQKNTTT